MNTSGEFLLDRGIWGWLYKLLTPLEWLMTQVMVLFHKFLTLLGMAPIGISWVLAIVFLVLVVHACILPIYLNPLFTLVGSAILLDEHLTVIALIGAACIMGGVYMAGKK